MLLKLEDASSGVNIVMMMFFELLFFNSEIFLSKNSSKNIIITIFIVVASSRYFTVETKKVNVTRTEACRYELIFQKCITKIFCRIIWGTGAKTPRYRVLRAFDPYTSVHSVK